MVWVSAKKSKGNYENEHENERKAKGQSKQTRLQVEFSNNEEGR